MVYVLTASYPQLYFPCISSTTNVGNTVVGFEAYKPDNRINGLHHPVASSQEIDMVNYYKSLMK